MRWVASPNDSSAATSRLQHLEGTTNSLGSVDTGGLYSPASQRETSTAEEELLKEQLHNTSRRMEELESEVQQGSRALDVANVKLAEQLLLCSTLSAKLLWPEDRASPALVELTDAQEEDTACTIDPFDEPGSRSKEGLSDFLPDDPIESLSASDSELGHSYLAVSSASLNDKAILESALQSPERSVEGRGSRKAEHVRKLRLPGIYERITEFIFQQHQKHFKYRILSSWRSKARERRWSLTLARDKISGFKRSLQKKVIQEWSATCRRWLWLRRAWAKLECRSERYYLRKFLGLWCERRKQQVAHECDWDCGFIGNVDEVAAHEETCEAMALATAWKVGTELSLRPYAKSSVELQKGDRDRLMRWIPDSEVDDGQAIVPRAMETLRWYTTVFHALFGHG